MRRSAAHALLSDVALVEHDASADVRCQRFLAAWAYRHSSQVSAQWPGAIVLELRASFRLFGPWPRFEARLRIDALTAPLSNMISGMLGMLPNLIAAAVIGVVGWIVARVVREVVRSAEHTS